MEKLVCLYFSLGKWSAQKAGKSYSQILGGIKKKTNTLAYFIEAPVTEKASVCIGHLQGYPVRLRQTLLANNRVC